MSFHFKMDEDKPNGWLLFLLQSMPKHLLEARSCPREMYAWCFSPEAISRDLGTRDCENCRNTWSAEWCNHCWGSEYMLFQIEEHTTFFFFFLWEVSVYSAVGPARENIFRLLFFQLLICTFFCLHFRNGLSEPFQYYWHWTQTFPHIHTASLSPLWSRRRMESLSFPRFALPAVPGCDCAQFWTTHYKKDVEVLECVQRTVMKMWRIWRMHLMGTG